MPGRNAHEPSEEMCRPQIAGPAACHIILPRHYTTLTGMESDASRGNTMAEGAEKKIKDIEEELRVVGANMQQLEIGEEKTMAREESSQVWLGASWI